MITNNPIEHAPSKAITIDYYLSNPPIQPKSSIAHYVKDNGILVPNIYENLKEATKALRRGEKVIARSEHPGDYADVSGILPSESMDRYSQSLFRERNILDRYINIVFNKKNRFDATNLKELIIFDPKNDSLLAGMNQYCTLSGRDFAEFVDEISFSFWKLLDGFNWRVVADSSIKGKYHIVTTWGDPGERKSNYTIFQDGKQGPTYSDLLPSEMRENIPKMVYFYEMVRNLERFDPFNCPTIEGQTFEGKNYFLQYLLGRKFNPPKFVLDRERSKDEKEVLFVRGATRQSGISCNVVYHYAWFFGFGSPDIHKHEDGSFDLHINLPFSELMVRNRVMQPIDADEYPLETVLNMVANGHHSYSKIFKPEISVVMRLSDHYSRDERSMMIKKVYETKSDAMMQLYLISDGNRAYLRRE
jgi:hypothetical protein